MLAVNGCASLSPRARLLLPSSHPSASTARPEPTGNPDDTGELSHAEALSSPSLAPKPSHQQVFHHPNPRAQLLTTMVTREQSPGE